MSASSNAIRITVYLLLKKNTGGKDRRRYQTDYRSTVAVRLPKVSIGNPAFCATVSIRLAIGCVPR